MKLKRCCRRKYSNGKLGDDDDDDDEAFHGSLSVLEKKMLTFFKKGPFLRGKEWSE